MQRAVNITIEDEVFYMWFANVHCWVTDMFSIGRPREYISGKSKKVKFSPLQALETLRVVRG
jgi:hypothetical protein